MSELFGNPYVLSLVISLVAVALFDIVCQWIIAMEVEELKEMSRFLRKEIIKYCFCYRLKRRIGIATGISSLWLYHMLTSENYNNQNMLLVFSTAVSFPIIFAFDVNALIQKLHWATEVSQYPRKTGMVKKFRLSSDDGYFITFDDGSHPVEYSTTEENFQRVCDRMHAFCNSDSIAFCGPSPENRIAFLVLEQSSGP